MKEPNIDIYNEQLAQLQELGGRLRQLREEKSISLETIAEATCIQPRLLRAIEDADLDTLPEPIYIRQFLQKYADALGLKEKKYGNSFPLGSSISQYKKPRWLPIPLPDFQLRPFHLYLFYIFLIVGSVQVMGNLIQSTSIPLTSEPSQNKTTPAVGVTKAQTPKVIQPVANTAVNQAPVKPVVVQITLKDESWLQVVVDGKTEFEGTLPKNTHRTWVANKQLTVRAGNAGGVLVAFNDKGAQKLGQPGQVQEVTYKANPPS